LIEFRRTDRLHNLSIWGARALPFPRAFFLCADRRELDRAFLPGFLTGLRLCAAYQLKQTAGASSEIDIVA
jgi:hypothetical protein